MIDQPQYEVVRKVGDNDGSGSVCHSFDIGQRVVLCYDDDSNAPMFKAVDDNEFHQWVPWADLEEVAE